MSKKTKKGIKADVAVLEADLEEALARIVELEDAAFEAEVELRVAEAGRNALYRMLLESRQEAGGG